jgi:hypothetical protein
VRHRQLGCWARVGLRGASPRPVRCAFLSRLSLPARSAGAITDSPMSRQRSGTTSQSSPHPEAAVGSPATGGAGQQACHRRRMPRRRWRFSARRASRAVRPSCCRRAR